LKVIVKTIIKARKVLSRSPQIMRFYAMLHGWRTQSFDMQDAGVQVQYAIYGTPDKSSPLILVLHGSNGTIYEIVNTLFAKMAKNLGFVIVCVEAKHYGFYGKEHGENEVLACMRHVVTSYNIDKNNIFLMGISAGGGAAASIALNYAQQFAAIACFYATLDDRRLSWGIAQAIHKIPFFVAHGVEDTVVPIDASERFVEILERNNYEFVWHRLRGFDHNKEVIDKVAKECIDFFLKHRDFNHQL
jgi:predicted esterase